MWGEGGQELKNLYFTIGIVSQKGTKMRLEASELSSVSPRRVRAGVPTPFANDSFEGKILLFVRDPALPPTPSANSSGAAGRRLWEVQMQGRFLRPVENFFMGMELSEVMRMSFMLRSVCSAALSFVKTYEPDIRVSFGVSKGEQVVELPHLVTPLFKGVDFIMETLDGSGEPPPALGSDVLSLPKRPKSERPQSVRLDATYTMSVYSTFVDLFTWKVKSMPVIGAVDMGAYFRDSGLRIVTYAVTGPSRKDKSHPETDKEYILKLQIDPPHIRPEAVSRQSTPTPEGLGSERSCSSRGSSPVAGLALTTLAAGRRRISSKKKKAKKKDAAEGARQSALSPSAVPSLGGASDATGPAPAADGKEGPAAAAEPPPHKSAETCARPVEDLCAPPLFRQAIGADTQERLDEEAAQQRLLMWMAGTHAGAKHGGHRRTPSDPTQSTTARRSWSARLLSFRGGAGPRRTGSGSGGAPATNVAAAGSDRRARSASSGGRYPSLGGKKPARGAGGAFVSIVDGLPDM